MSCEVEIRGEKLVLLPDKAIYWQNDQSILLSDLHLGKAGHFRKHGIPVPATIHFHDLIRLEEIICQTNPANIYFLGDLFHSDINQEWDMFCEWLEKYKSIRFVLVKGNHDILMSVHYQMSNLELVDSLHVGPFLLTHEKCLDDEHYNLSGHVHPGVGLRGVGKQGTTIPCYYFQQQFGLLPAFGNFTGLYKIRPRQTDQVFGIVENAVVNLMT
ncbi:MAG: ligase-associated DNA damage response endonuclease PdeM [Cyclobacteriaceae bacterium]